MKRQAENGIMDLVVVGAGSGGYAAARTAAAAGAKVAVVDGSERLGGLCILRGCMPTKALLESAHRYHEIKRAGEFGLQVKGVGMSWKKIVERKNRLIDDFADYRRKQLEGGKFKLFRGRGSFVSENELEVFLLDGKRTRVKSRAFVVATGSVVARRSIEGLDSPMVWTSDDAIENTKALKSLIVLGGRAVAVELAQYFAHLGVQVTIIQRSSHLLPNQDADVSLVLEEAFRKDGIAVHTGTELVAIKAAAGSASVRFRKNGKVVEVRAERVLNALGREPATKGLNLEEIGVKLAQGKIVCKATQQSSRPMIFAAGDVCGPYDVVHLAIQQGEVAARNALRLIRGEKGLEKMDYRLRAEAVFTEPQIASVGMNQKEAREAGIDCIEANYPFNDHGKSMVMGATDGFVRIVAEKKRGEIIGAQIVGPMASDLIHEFIVAMRYRATVHEFAAIPHYHPTLAEIVTYPAEELAEQIEVERGSAR